MFDEEAFLVVSQLLKAVGARDFRVDEGKSP